MRLAAGDLLRVQAIRTGSRHPCRAPSKAATELADILA